MRFILLTSRLKRQGCIYALHIKYKQLKSTLNSLH
jgi:hypothetical protein